MEERDAVPPVWEDQAITGKTIDLFSLLSVYAGRWPFMILMGAGGFLVGLAISLCLTPTFNSKAVFLPPTQHVSALDNPLALLVKTPSSSIYSGLILSDSVLTDVIEHTNLQTIFKTRNIEETRVALRQKTTVSTDSSGFVKLEVAYKDPKLAHDIASNYLTALARLNDRLAISEAAQQRLLFQGALEREKNALEDAEVALKKAQEASGVVLPQSQTQAGLRAIDTTRSEIRFQEVRLAALLQAKTEQSPDVVRARSAIQALESQLHRLEGNTQAAAGAGLSAASAPAVNLEFVKLEREVKYHQVLFDVTAKEYENARLQETSAAPGVQVVDFPETPIKKSWPPRALFAIVGGIVGFFLALVAIFVKDRWNVLSQNPEHAISLQGLRDAFAHAKLRP